MKRFMLRRKKLIAQDVAQRYFALMTPTDGFRKRLIALRDACGGWKPMARWCGVSDVTLQRWAEKGTPPLLSKLKKICMRTELSLEWFAHGRGHASVELAKARHVPVGGEITAPPSDNGPSITDVAQYIEDYGDEDEVKFVGELLEAAKRRIHDRHGASSRLQPHSKAK